MKIINASYEILTEKEELMKAQKAIEIAGRTCYKSEEKITEDSAEAFVRMLRDRGHEAMIEHGPALSVRFIVDRGITHEMVRHRVASFAQESTRYCNYSKGKFGNELTFIKPLWLDEGFLYSKNEWMRAMQDAESHYFRLIEKGGWTPQQARSVLPNSLKAEIIITANLREWRHIFKLRTSTHAHPQIREVMCPLLDEMIELLPSIFDDIKY